MARIDREQMQRGRRPRTLGTGGADAERREEGEEAGWENIGGEWRERGR